MTVMYIVILLLATLSRDALAQRHDVRLSRPFSDPVLTASIFIQASARIGSRSLIVWGTTRPGTQAAPKPALVLQVLRDTTPVTAPLIFTDPEAEPSGFLQVIALRRSYLILWKDVRAGRVTTQWAVADTNGVARSLGELFPAAISPIGVIRSFAGSGYRLDWSAADTASNTVHTLMLDSAAVPSGERMQTAYRRITGVVRPGNTPGYTLLECRDTVPIVLGPEGREVILSASVRAKLAASYFLSDDGGIVAVSSDTVRVYRTMLDSVPVRQLIASLPDSADRRSCVPTVGPHGGIRISYLAPFSRPALVLGNPAIAYCVAVGSVVEDSRGLLSVRQSHGERQIYIHKLCDTVEPLPPYIRIAHLCDSRMMVQVAWPFNIKYGCIRLRAEQATRRLQAAFDWKGPISEWGVPLECPVPMDVPVGRETSSDGSVVKAIVDLDTARLVAPAATVPANVNYYSPVIMTRRDTLVVAWQTDAVGDRLETGVLTGDTSNPILFRPPVSLSPPVSFPGFRQEQRYSYMLPTNGGLVHAWNLLTYLDVAGTLTEHIVTDIHVPTPGGWSIIRTPPVEGRLVNQTVHASRNPGDGRTLVWWDARMLDDSTEKMHVLSIDDDGNVAWHIDSPDVRGHDQCEGLLLPIDGDEYYLINCSQTRRMNRDRLVSLSSDQSQSFSYPHQAKRLTGDRAMMTIDMPEYGGRFMDLFSIQGTWLTRHSVQAPYPPRSVVHVIENPLDSGFLLLYGTAKGLILTRTDRMFVQFPKNVRISEGLDTALSPYGEIRGDTLFFVWERIRNGEHGVYTGFYPLGSMSQVSIAADAPADGDVSADIANVFPVPASLTVMLTLEATSDRPRRGEIVNVLGQVVSVFLVEPGRRDIPIDVSALPQGEYFARIEAGPVRRLSVQR